MKTVTAEFTIVDGQEKACLAAASILVDEVRANEPGTVLYLASVRLDTTESSRLLLMIEGYVNEQAFEHHIAAGSAWSNFADLAKHNGWLVTDASNPTGLKSTFASLDLKASLVRLNGELG